ncbi:conserved exported hypothetical protein [Burkholderiales bacterium 8X]|nr:conserved exported hypothetical protein [Burkholderiales bacterium 8X]
MHLRPIAPAALLLALSAGAAQAQEYNRYQGAWQGDFMFSVTQPDVGAKSPPVVLAGSLSIDADGQVQGRVPEAGCRLSGTSFDFVSPANATLEVDLQGCADARFNLHFTGRLINNPVLRYASLRLAAKRDSDAATLQLTAVVRR